METTYTNRQGNLFTAIHLPWAEAEIILGRPHEGSPEDDAALVASLVAAGGPAWLAAAEGWVDGAGWGLIGPAVDDGNMEIINYETFTAVMDAAGDIPEDEHYALGDEGGDIYGLTEDDHGAPLRAVDLPSSWTEAHERLAIYLDVAGRYVVVTDVHGPWACTVDLTHLDDEDDGADLSDEDDD